MQNVYVVEGYNLHVGRHRAVYANKEKALQVFAETCNIFNENGTADIVKEAESFTIFAIDEGFIRFANLSETEYIGVYVKEIITDAFKPEEK